MSAAGSVQIINTGGTITMVDGRHGLEPAADFAQRFQAQLCGDTRASLPDLDVRDWSPLLDSSCLRPEHWLRLAREISASTPAEAPCVILHGTDTLAYSACALHFLMGEQPGRRIILTGSQYPLSHPQTDAISNLLGALCLASAEQGIQGVQVSFGTRVLHPAALKKLSSSHPDAFDSPRHPPLGRIEAPDQTRIRAQLPTVQLEPDARIGGGCAPAVDILNLGPETASAATALEQAAAQVQQLDLRPGLSLAALEGADPAPVLLLLGLYGSGNGPADDSNFRKSLIALQDRETVVLGYSACLFGHVDRSSAYASGQALADLGVHLLGGITAEAAWVKGVMAVASGLRGAALTRAMCTDWGGEIP